MYKYYKLTISIQGEENQENAIALLNYQSNFESVVQEEKQLIFSYQTAQQPKKELEEVLLDLRLSDDWLIENEKEINWNEQYEKTFQPITLANGSWGVRASFHKPLSVENEIVIDPKMSFGTGHHETTKQVMEMMTTLDFDNANVWDYGSGTGILAIMAEKLGAVHIKANDNEEWAYNNSLENAEINKCRNTYFFLGNINQCESAGFLEKSKDNFDIIIANITKNILLDSALMIDQYSHEGTKLLLSGFYQNDIPDIEKKYNAHHFFIERTSALNHWACLHLIKK